ncbi:MAG TPA: hypothetical protein VNZ45_01580 [Bacteroidia bacterium]|jgi:hypothetical protein|nr:hypothetical protein [Bacteroidia bacterium]
MPLANEVEVNPPVFGKNDAQAVMVQAEIEINSKLDKDGGTLDGPLRVDSQLTIYSPDARADCNIETATTGVNCSLQFKTLGITRWILSRKSNGVFTLDRHSTNGTFQESVFTVNQQTGILDFAHPPTFGSAEVDLQSRIDNLKSELAVLMNRVSALER